MSSISNIVKKIATISVTCLLPLGAFAGSSESTEGGSINLATAGMMLCGGNHYFRASSNAQVVSSYAFRNFHPEATREITRIRVYDATGGLRCDYPGIDAHQNTFKSVLVPHASTSLVTRKMDICHNPIPDDLTTEFRPLQVEVTWVSVDHHATADHFPLVANYSTRLVDVDTRIVLSQSKVQCETAR